MSTQATVRVLSAEEIAASAGGQTPFLQWPQRSLLFAERAMRLRQLAAGHAMGDFLRFMAEIALAQQAALQAHPAVPLPDAGALDRAAQLGAPPLPAAEWPRDGAWRSTLRSMLPALRAQAPAAAQQTIDRIGSAGDDWLEQQAQCLLHGVTLGLDLGAAPIVGAALQVYWTQLLLGLQRVPNAIGRIDDRLACPCCGSRPTASLVRSGGDVSGQRYLHCSLCSLQWHLERIRCAHCGSDKRIAFQSLAIDGMDEAAGAAAAVVQAETCDDCGHYMKIVHGERDAQADPVADDLASVTLDLLVAESGLQRHGVNLMLLFGEGDHSG